MSKLRRPCPAGTEVLAKKARCGLIASRARRGQNASRRGRGGASTAAAKRAARLADHFIPTVPEFFETFREERKRLGEPDTGPLPKTTGNFPWVAEDPDAAWERISPHAMYENNAYGAWVAATGGDASHFQRVEDPDALRASGTYPVMTPDELIETARTRARSTP